MFIDDLKKPIMITPSEVMEYLYCPRFTYFLNVLKVPQHEDNRYKVQKGRRVHEKRLQDNRDYLRKKIDMMAKDINVYLSSSQNHIRGIVDEVAFMRDGTLAPIDYKYSPYKEYAFKTHKIQITLYSLLIEETYRKPVNKGYIFYIRNGSKMNEIPITLSLKQEALEIVNTILKIIREERLPQKTKVKIRCFDCCYKNICV